MTILKKTRRSVLGLTILALAISGAIASTASAAVELPEFRPAKDKYTVTFSSLVYEEGNGIIQLRPTGTAKGSITGPKTGTVSGMEWSETGFTIKFLELETRLVYLHKATHEVALLLTPKTGVTLASTVYGGFPGEIRGSLLVPISTRKSPEREWKVLGTRGVQSLSEYENEKGEKVKVKLESDIYPADDGEFFKCSLQFTGKMKLEQELEIAA